MVKQVEILLPAMGRGYHLITDYVLKAIGDLPQTGIMNIFIKHTSAGLTLNENADPSVRHDFEVFMNDLVPDGYHKFTHTMEGDDDMSAHLKSSIIGQSLTIPITNHQPNLGTWQGIYLCEFRNHARGRKIVITVYGE